MKRFANWKLFSLAALTVIAAAALALAFSLPASAAPLHQGDQPPAAETITVTGFGEANGSPDVANLEMGVEVVNQEIGPALDQVNEAITNVINALTEMGIAEDDIQTTGLSLWPEDQFAQGGPTGQRQYRVRNTVRVAVRDLEQVEGVIQAGIDAGANTIYGLSFGLEDAATLQQEARSDAFEDARQRAQQLADLAGVTLGEPVSVSEVYQPGFAPMYSAAGLGGGGGGMGPVQSGQLAVNVQIEVTFSIAR